MYKLLNGPTSGQLMDFVLKQPATFIPCDPVNTDYQEYLKWLEEGNTPEPADEVTQ